MFLETRINVEDRVRRVVEEQDSWENEGCCIDDAPLLYEGIPMDELEVPSDDDTDTDTDDADDADADNSGECYAGVIGCTRHKPPKTGAATIGSNSPPSKRNAKARDRRARRREHVAAAKRLEVPRISSPSLAVRAHTQPRMKMLSQRHVRKASNEMADIDLGGFKASRSGFVAGGTWHKRRGVDEIPSTTPTQPMPSLRTFLEDGFTVHAWDGR